MVSARDRIEPVGVVRCTRSAPDDDQWDRETTFVELLPPFSARSLTGLAEFSHCLIVYLFDKAAWDPSKMCRRPRGNPDWPEVGIFSQRAKDRPNRLGVTVCQVLGVDGVILHLAGLDAIDGSPVLDIKPWMAEFGPRGSVAQPEWATELMKGYW